MTGLVLAGGRSRRMGWDKALIEVAGDALVLRVGRVLEEVCDRVLVASGEDDRYELGWEQVLDLAPDAAPSLRRLVEAGKRSVVPALSEIGARVVGEELWGEVDRRFTRNVSRLEDLEDLDL